MLVAVWNRAGVLAFDLFGMLCRVTDSGVGSEVSGVVGDVFARDRPPPALCCNVALGCHVRTCVLMCFVDGTVGTSARPSETGGSSSSLLGLSFRVSRKRSGWSLDMVKWVA